MEGKPAAAVLKHGRQNYQLKQALSPLESLKFREPRFKTSLKQRGNTLDGRGASSVSATVAAPADLVAPRLVCAYDSLRQGCLHYLSFEQVMTCRT